MIILWRVINQITASITRDFPLSFQNKKSTDHLNIVAHKIAWDDMNMMWACQLCTYNNDDGDLACLMCQTERRRTKSKNDNSSEGKGEPKGSSDDGEPALINSLSDCCNDHRKLSSRDVNDGRDGGDSDTCQFNNNASSRLPNNNNNNNNNNKQDEDISAELMDGEGKEKKWDAFASLEQNYESSEEDESDCSNGSDGGGDEDDDSSDDDEDEDRDFDPEDKQNNDKKCSFKKPAVETECVDLVDSEEDDDDEQEEEDDDSDCELEVVKMSAPAMKGKENNKSDKKSSRRQRRQEKQETYAINVDGDSDSSLSEVESRPLPSPSSRQVPPWQRRSYSRSTPIKTSNGNLKSSDDFACMHGRNDVFGGSGSGVNGVRLANMKGDDDKPAGRRKSRKRASTSASTATSSKAATKTTKRRQRTSSKTSSKAKAPARRRKRGSYTKRSNKRSTTRGGGRTGGNAAWSARERGIRGGQRGGGGTGSAPYMAIAKQEPMLANIGGANIQF